MKTPIFRPQNVGIMLALSLCLSNQALATASYNSGVDLSYSISVPDSTNPTAGDTTGLTILGTYLQPTDVGSFYANTSGDGVDQAFSSNLAEVAITAYLTALSASAAVPDSAQLIVCIPVCLV